MPWGRLDDRANGNGKLLALSDAAWRMWGCGLIHCQAQLTDGFIAEAVIFTFGVKAKNKRAVADELCTALIPGRGPLWHKVEGGYQVHDYLDWNDSKETVDHRRMLEKRRLALFQNPELRHQVRQRDGDDCRYCGRTVRWNDRKGPNGGTYDHVDPRGDNSLENLVVACRSCNASKGARTPEEAGMQLRLIAEKPNGKSRSESRSEQTSTSTTTPIKEISETSSQTPDQRKPHPIRDFLSLHERLFSERFSQKPAKYGAADAALAKAVIEHHGEEEARELLTRFMASTDPFIVKAGFGVNVFKSQINKLLTEGAAAARPRSAGPAYSEWECPHVERCGGRSQCTTKLTLGVDKYPVRAAAAS
jgi:5-methylcytosine-specific restriction endonuclease McrA